MEWQLKPSTWDLDVPQQAKSDNMRSSNSLQIHNGQWGLQEDDYRGVIKVCIEGLVGKIHDQSHHHDGNHIIGAWQKGFHFPTPSTSGTNTTNMSGDSGSSSGFPAAPTTDCSNENQQAAPFPSKDPVELHNYDWLYSGSIVEIPRVASGLNAGKVDNTNHSYANDDDYRNHQQQGYNNTINGNGAQLIGANGTVVGGNKEIIIAPKRRYPKEDGKINRSEGAMAMATGSCAYKKLNMGSGGRVQVPRCQVDGCKEDLGKAKKDYHRRHKVCEMHSKAPQVITSGIEQRFCQQCSRFHAISEFDDSKKSCRRRLAGHNERRRKLSQDTTTFSLASMFQDERRHLDYIQYPLSMPLLPRIYKNQDTRRSRSKLEEACRAQLALMNGGILPRNSTNRLLSIMHACKDSSSPHDTLKYTNTNNHDNNNNPSIVEGLTLCSSNSINIDRGSQPSASAN